MEQLLHPGFPLAELAADGSAVITKHPGTGGVVDRDTVTAQLLYEIAGPRYAGPDVVARFDTIELADDGPDRVRISGVRGERPPPDVKVCLNALGGHRNEVTFVLTGDRLDAKEAFARAQFEASLPARPAELVWSRLGEGRPDADTEAGASVLLRCQALDPSAEVVGRAFSGAAVEMALAGYPGFHLTAPPGNGSPYGVYTRGVRAADRGTARRRPARRHAGRRRSPAGHPPARRRPSSALMAMSAGVTRRAAAGCGGAGAERGQGRDGERRRLDAHRRRLRVAGRHAHPRSRARSCCPRPPTCPSPCTRCRTCGR